MSIRDHFTIEDIACPPDTPCTLKIGVTAVSSAGTVRFYGGLFSSCATGFGIDVKKWTFKIGSETFGPVVESTVGSFSQITLTDGLAAGAILNIDWTNFQQPVFTQDNDLPAGIIIHATWAAEDQCGCSGVSTTQIGMTDDELIPPPEMIIHFTGDGSTPAQAGFGTDVNTSAADGNVTVTGQVLDFATGLVPTGPMAGCSLVLSLIDAKSGQTLNRFTFDYSSTIDFTTDSPTASLDPTFTRQDGTTLVLTWAILQPYILAGSEVNSTGALAIDLDKFALIMAQSLAGCTNAIEGNGIDLDFVAYMACTGVSNSPTSTVSNPRLEVPARLAQPIHIAQESTTGEVLFVDGGGPEQNLRTLDLTTECIGTLEEVSIYTDGLASGTLVYSGLIRDSTRQINGRDVFYMLNADSTGTSTHTLFQLGWNPALNQWDCTTLLQDVDLTDIHSLDTTRQVNGRPSILGSSFGNFNFFYWTGTGDTYAVTKINGATYLGTANGATAPTLDPVTGDIYLFALSAAPGTQWVFRINHATDPTIAANWSGTRVGALDVSIDATGQMPAAHPSTVGFNVGSVVYAGQQLNNGPVLLITDRVYDYVRTLSVVAGGTGLPGEFEILNVAGDGTPATTDGIGGAAQVDNPQGICQSTTDPDLFYFVERFSNYVRSFNISTGQVTTLHARENISVGRDNLYG